MTQVVIARGDLTKLSPQERGRLYGRVCASVGLNPFTRPFEYLLLNGKLTLYARKDATDQLRAIHGISVTDLIESEREGVYIVTAKVANAAGRTDAAKGAVSIAGLKGEFLANAMMKAETKAKRRATLSICGLGFTDESEADDIPGARRSRGNDDFQKIAADPTVPSVADDLAYVDEAPAKPEVEAEMLDSTEANAINRAEAPPPEDDYESRSEAYARGMKDFRDGRTACLDRAINGNPEALKEWRRGFADAKRR
jgi:hypothetical protein